MGTSEGVKILLVEDDFLIADSLIECLATLGDYSIVHYDNGEEAIANFSALNPEVVIMDIELAGKLDGITTVQRLHQKSKVPIIFLTDYANPEVMRKISYLEVVNFLVKPFDELLVASSIEKALSITNKTNEQTKAPLMEGYIFVHEKDGHYEKLAINNIMYLIAGGSYCSIYCKAGKSYVSVAKNMKAIQESIAENALDPSKFLHIHKSHTVNVDCITGFQGNQVILEDGKRLDIGKTKQQEIKAMFKML